MFGLRRGGDGSGGGMRGGIDGEVLAELRAIREEIHGLSERVAQSATREDLADYVTKEVFQAHVESGRRATDLWNRWGSTALAGVAVVWSVVGPYVLHAVH